MKQSSGTGKGGKSFQDRELAANVRTLALNQIMQVLNGDLYNDDNAFHKAVLLKLAGTVLPRLNEHTGADGNELVLVISGETAARYDIGSHTSPKSETGGAG